MNFQKIALTLTGIASVNIMLAGGAVAQEAVVEQDTDADNTLSLQQKSTQKKAQKIADGIYKATGFGNTFLVTTDEGNVVIDTSLRANALDHKKLLDNVSNKVPKYIVLTHGHGDHTGGVDQWKGTGTKVIAQAASQEFLHYQKRLAGFFANRNAAQFGFELNNLAPSARTPGNFKANIPATILFRDQHSFKLGKLTFEIASMPSETLDALTVWIPERKAVFTGDLFYQSFPNIYTLRGTKPRWALDYVAALDRVIALAPEIVIPSHGEPIYGGQKIRDALTQQRDAILFVHDAVVDGMNHGKNVYSLMDEIKLPPELVLGETYGTVAWSVRGIYEGYAGWFDGDASTLLGIHPNAADVHLVELAGGPYPVLERANSLIEKGNLDEALTLVDSVLSAAPNHRGALLARISILETYAKTAKNFNTAGWLGHGIRQAKGRLVDQGQ